MVSLVSTWVYTVKDVIAENGQDRYDIEQI